MSFGKVNFRESLRIGVSALLLILVCAFDAPLVFAQAGGIESLRETSKAFASVARPVLLWHWI
jgi:hypothetical protein